MTLHSEFMGRCLQLAAKGGGFTKPNPMVGAVIVHNNKIIGEGFHRKYGEAHAEVNAIDSVENKALLENSTLYVSLEPCAHHGRTPPCAELIIKNKIPRVIIAVKDPNPKVAGKGIEMMRVKGVKVITGVLEKEATELNRVFFVNQIQWRPYLILKWAQSRDGFMDYIRTSRTQKPAMISNSLTHTIVHKFRTEVEGILVGTNTALLDNPRLTTRNWYGKHPTRIVIDRTNKIPDDSAIFDDSVPTIVFTQSIAEGRLKKEQLKQITIDFNEDVNKQIVSHLFEEKIHSVLIEGGRELLCSFIERDMWDEAYVEMSAKRLFAGVKAPHINGCVVMAKNYLDSTQLHLKNETSRNIL